MLLRSDLPLLESVERFTARLENIYSPELARQTAGRIVTELAVFKNKFPARQHERLWDQRDVLLISYGNSIVQEGQLPLRVLSRFLDQRLKGFVNVIHLLPFFPFSSDDGFAVIDYRKVNPLLGCWEDVARINKSFELMFDLVINHVSSHHQWFEQFIRDELPGKNYFITPPPQAELDKVVRPRESSLLTPVATAAGKKDVWTTFSADQVDVNFANPDVLLEYVRILLDYLAKGARIIRLDAIAFLWKEYATSCMNLSQTHEFVRLLRELLDAAVPQTLLLTETNVPHQQNVSYFGDSDEAHMVYQFSLAPLLLHSLFRGNAHYLNHWARRCCLTPPGCTFLNFTASHDGIGMRPLEGLLPQGEIDLLLKGMEQFGGQISYRTNNDGSKSAYEINITYFDALKGTWLGEDSWQIARFLLAQTLMLGLRGIPAFYIHSLLATPNDYAGVEKGGRARLINRHSWDLHELENLLGDFQSPQAIVFNELRRRIKIRQQQAAFHPDARQQIIHLGDHVCGFWRYSPDGRERILAIHNITDQLRPLYLAGPLEGKLSGRWQGLLTGEEVNGLQATVQLPPYHVLWLKQVE